MSLLLFFRPVRNSSAVIIPPIIPVGAVGGGGGGWANPEFIRRKKKGKTFKEVLVRYLKGGQGTQEEIEVEINVDFGRVLSNFIVYEDARAREYAAKEEAERLEAKLRADKAERLMKRLVKARETAEAIRTVKVIEEYVKTKKKRKQWQDDEDLLILKLFEDDL